MFTGIVEEIGSIKSIQRGENSAILNIYAERILDDLKIGDSVAINGVCLTVTDLNDNGFTADVMHETMNRTGLAKVIVGSNVNIERAMGVNGRFGGHIVLGHVDGVGKILKIERDDNAIWYTVQANKDITRYIVEKGSIALDGISLTVARVGEEEFAISAIPHTVNVTILKEKKIGDMVNVEVDIIGKYVEKLLCTKVKDKEDTNLTYEFLAQNGF